MSIIGFLIFWNAMFVVVSILIDKGDSNKWKTYQ